MTAISKYYIYKTKTKSGITHYADDFYAVVLKERGFIQIDIEAVNNQWLGNLSRETVFHIELGNGQFAARDTLILLLKNGFFNVDVTVHDAPWITFPFYSSNCNFINQVSKAFDWYLSTFGVTGRCLKKCRHVYVLTQKGKSLLEKRHGLANVQYIPHIINPDKIWNEPLIAGCNDIMFFGFIGANKGLEYALELHTEIRKHNPNVQMCVVGEAFNSKAQSYLNKLKVKYSEGVCYLGFVEADELEEIFLRVGHVFLPLLPYKYWCPCNGSILASLRRGRIVWTNPVNAIPEIINDNFNGRYFSGNLYNDAKEFLLLTDKKADLTNLSKAALHTCNAMYLELKQTMSKINCT